MQLVSAEIENYCHNVPLSFFFAYTQEARKLDSYTIQTVLPFTESGYSGHVMSLQEVNLQLKATSETTGEFFFMGLKAVHTFAVV